MVTHDAPTPSRPRPPLARRARAVVWRAYLDMQRQLNAQLNRDMQDESGLSIADFSVLVQLSEHADGRMRVLELARALRLGEEPAVPPAHPDAAARPDRAVELQRGPPRRVRRAHRRGPRAVEAAAPRHVESVRRYLFDALTADQVDALGEVATPSSAGSSARADRWRLLRRRAARRLRLSRPDRYSLLTRTGTTSQRRDGGGRRVSMVELARRTSRATCDPARRGRPRRRGAGAGLPARGRRRRRLGHSGRAPSPTRWPRSTRAPGCVLLDLGLPDADGYGAVHDIVDAAPTSRSSCSPAARSATASTRSAPARRTTSSRTRSPASCWSARSATRGAQAGPARAAAAARGRLSAAEQARLERGLLPTPLLRTDAVDLRHLLPPRPRRRRARRRLLRRRRDRRRPGPGRHRRRHGPRPGRGRARRPPAGRVAHAAAGRRARRADPARRWRCCSTPSRPSTRATRRSATSRSTDGR